MGLSQNFVLDPRINVIALTATATTTTTPPKKQQQQQQQQQPQQQHQRLTMDGTLALTSSPSH